MLITFTLKCPQDCLVKKFKLQSTTGEQISIFEFNVFDFSGVNFALQKRAAQSSTFKKFEAANAVDGSNATFSHTNDDSAWLEVDLTVPLDVQRY